MFLPEVSEGESEGLRPPTGVSQLLVESETSSWGIIRVIVY